MSWADVCKMSDDKSSQEDNEDDDKKDNFWKWDEKDKEKHTR